MPALPPGHPPGGRRQGPTQGPRQSGPPAPGVVPVHGVHRLVRGPAQVVDQVGQQQADQAIQGDAMHPARASHTR